MCVLTPGKVFRFSEMYLILDSIFGGLVGERGWRAVSGTQFGELVGKDCDVSPPPHSIRGIVEET